MVKIPTFQNSHASQVAVCIVCRNVEMCLHFFNFFSFYKLMRNLCSPSLSEFLRYRWNRNKAWRGSESTEVHVPFFATKLRAVTNAFGLVFLLCPGCSPSRISCTKSFPSLRQHRSKNSHIRGNSFPQAQNDLIWKFLELAWCRTRFQI